MCIRYIGLKSNDQDNVTYTGLGLCFKNYVFMKLLTVFVINH